MSEESIISKLNIDPSNLRAYSTGLLQGTAYNNLHAYLSQTLLSFELSVPQWKFLGQLHEHGPMRLAELADYLSYDPPQVTKIAKALEKKKYVKRAPDRNDERAKSISITPSGSSLVESVEPEVKKALAYILKGITPDELRIYIKVLALIVDNTRT
jgi:DNA-binding MarR family transcriptional regulator